MLGRFASWLLPLQASGHRREKSHASVLKPSCLVKRRIPRHAEVRFCFLVASIEEG